MSMNEWVIYLDPKLQVTEVKKRHNVIHEPDPDNGPVGVMFANRLNGCIHDKWTAKLVDTSWRPTNPKHTFTWARERYPNDEWTFYTNTVDELGAFANLQTWLREQG